MLRWLIAFLFFGCSTTTYVHGVPNLVQVKAGLWRSGQPMTADQWQYLKSLGITRVVKLNFESEGSDNGAAAAGMTVYVFSIQPEGDKDVFDNITNTFIQPNPKLIMEALLVIRLGGGVLVHCTHGQDRTGLIIGEHRVVDDRWPKDAAYAEMITNNFHASLHGLHETWENFQSSKGDQ